MYMALVYDVTSDFPLTHPGHLQARMPLVMLPLRPPSSLFFPKTILLAESTLAVPGRWLSVSVDTYLTQLVLLSEQASI